MNTVTYRCMMCRRFYYFPPAVRHKCPSCVNQQFPHLGNMELVRWELDLDALSQALAFLPSLAIGGAV